MDPEKSCIINLAEIKRLSDELEKQLDILDNLTAEVNEQSAEIEFLSTAIKLYNEGRLEKECQSIHKRILLFNTMASNRLHEALMYYSEYARLSNEVFEEEPEQHEVIHD